MPRVDRLMQTERDQPFLHGWLEFGKRKVNLLRVELQIQVAQRIGRSGIQVSDRLCRDHHPPRFLFALCQESPDEVAKHCGVRKHQWSVPADNEKTGQCLRRWIALQIRETRRSIPKA